MKVVLERRQETGDASKVSTSDVGALSSVPRDWQLVRLGDLFDFRNGVNADGSAYGRGTPFVNVLEVITKTHISRKDIPGLVSLSDRLVASYRVLPGDVLFNRTSETQEEVGLSAVYLDDAVVVFGGFVIRGRPKTARFDPVYSGYALRSRLVRSQILGKGQGAIRANIGQADLRQVVVALPPLEEQGAIGAVLRDSDRLVQVLDNLVAKKSAMKRGLMQQLLTGKARLRDFRDLWTARALGDLGHWRGGMTPSMANANYWQGGTIPWVSSSDVSQGRVGRASYVTQRAVDETSVPVMPPNSILVVTRSGILRRFLPVTRIAASLAINQDIRALAPGPMHDSGFLQHSLIHNQKQILATCMKAGTTVESLDTEWFSAFKISMPPLNEQSAIAAVLDDVDAEIAALRRRRDKAAALKRGLMQNLLAGRLRPTVPSEVGSAS